jgi:hypothetical protein
MAAQALCHKQKIRALGLDAYAQNIPLVQLVNDRMQRIVVSNDDGQREVFFDRSGEFTDRVLTPARN